jgi:methyl-accepting chemotaxis protein
VGGAMQQARPFGFRSSLSRFLAFFTIQAIVLLGVVALCYRGLGRLRQGLEDLAGTLPKATVAAEVLHYSDVLRVIHVSLIGGGRNTEYVETRLKRLKEVEDLLESSIVTMEKIEWLPSERRMVETVAAGMREYSRTFPPILERARTATTQELPDLIQANTASRRDAYNLLLEKLPEIRAHADAVVHRNSADFRRLQLYIVTGLALTIFLSFWTFREFVVHNRRTRRQARELNRSMKALSDGDLSTTCEVISNDELGRVAENLNDIFKLLARNIRTIVEISGKLESVVDVVGSRSRTVMGSAEGQGAAVDKAYVSIDTLNGGIRKISLNVEALSASSEQTSSSTLELVASMEEVARHTDTLFASVEETTSATHEMVSSIREVDQNVEFLRNFVTDTSASMVEMSTSIGQVEKNAAHSHDLARNVCEAAESGMRAVRETTVGMDEIRRAVLEANEVVTRLGQRSTEIGRIINVIDDVASQTNLLALNAAILAAQAGDHGRGFSVVADEIRELSERTATSTREIGSLIRSVQSEVGKALESMSNGSRSVDRGVLLAGEAGRVLNQILASAEKSLHMSKDIAGAMKEQARGSESVANAVGRLQDMVKQISGATNQQASGSSHIRKAVEQMREVAKSVRQATVEQKTGSMMISNAAEQMIDMVRQISGVTMNQATDSEEIVKTMEQVRGIADGNRRSATDMNDSIGLLADAIRELDDQVRKFKVRSEPYRG